MKPRESEIGLSPLCSKTENTPRPPTRDSKPFINMHWWSTSTRLPASAASSKSQPTTYVFAMLSLPRVVAVGAGDDSVEENDFDARVVAQSRDAA